MIELSAYCVKVMIQTTIIIISSSSSNQTVTVISYQLHHLTTPVIPQQFVRFLRATTNSLSMTTGILKPESANIPLSHELSFVTSV